MGDPCRCSGFESHTTYHHVLVLVFLPVMKVVTSKKQMICLWFFFRFSILYIRLKSRSCITWTQTPNLLGKLRHQDGPLEICINLIYDYIQLLFAHIKWVDNSEFFFLSPSRNFKRVVSGRRVSVSCYLWYMRSMRRCPDGYGLLRSAIFIRWFLMICISQV